MTLAGLLLVIHLGFAAAATAAFWGAAAAPKGGRLHRRSGRAFAQFVYATAATGGVMAVASLLASGPLPDDAVQAAVVRAERHTMWLVLYVLLILVTPVQHGIAVVAAGPRPPRLRTRLHTILNLGSMAGTIALFPAALLWQQWLFLIVVPLGLLIGLRNIAYAARGSAAPAEWRKEHLTSMITAGVSLHTALMVFGTSRTLGWQLTGWSALVPWTLPAVLGLLVILWMRTVIRPAVSPGR